MSRPLPRDPVASPSRRPSVAVLGGCGFIGSHVCRRLVQCGYAVRVFDKVYTSRERIRDLETQLEVCLGDMSRPADVLEAIHDATTVIHLVHTSTPASSMVDPVHDVASNVAASAGWLRQLSHTKVRRVLYVSSGGMVYGVPRHTPIDEGHPTNPTTSYGITKLAIEKYIGMYCASSGLTYAVLRPANVYGPGQHLDIGQGAVGVFANRALHREALEIWGSGAVQRDYLFIDDLVGAIEHLLEYNGAEHIFNVGTGVGHSILDLVAILGRLIQPEPRLVFQPARNFDPPINVLDAAHLTRETGWHPRVSFAEGVARTVTWLQAHLGHIAKR